MRRVFLWEVEYIHHGEYGEIYTEETQSHFLHSLWPFVYISPVLRGKNC